MNPFKKKISNELLIIISFAAARLLIHLYTNAFAGYGYFRDELYYLACADNLDAGYVDHPPLSIYILWISRFIFGDSLFALRLIPAISASAVIYIAGLITLKLKGSITALVIALSCIMMAPISLGIHSIFSMNAFDWVLWSLFFYLVILLFTSDNKKYWYYIGIVMGLGMLNKTGFLWLGAGFLAALILTPARKTLSTRYPYYAAGIALAIFSPYIIWNIIHDFAHLEFIRNAVTYKYSSITYIDFIANQFLLQNPITFPFWIAGIVYLLKSKELHLRIPGIIFITAFLILLLNGHSKAEYLSPAYPLLFSAGAVLFESLTVRKVLHWIRYAYVILILFTGLLLIPAALPVLSAENYISYAETLGLQQKSAEGIELNELPQFYADMFGWENMAAEVSEVYTGLKDSEKVKTFVFAQNYGEAGAIDFYRSKYDLPEVYCPHNNYWIWGKKAVANFSYENVIIIGGNKSDHLNALMTVEYIKSIHSDYAIPYENNNPVYLGRGFKINILDLWERIRIYI